MSESPCPAALSTSVHLSLGFRGAQSKELLGCICRAWVGLIYRHRWLGREDASAGIFRYQFRTKVLCILQVLAKHLLPCPHCLKLFHCQVVKARPFSIGLSSPQFALVLCPPCPAELHEDRQQIRSLEKSIFLPSACTFWSLERSFRSW